MNVSNGLFIGKIIISNRAINKIDS